MAKVIRNSNGAQLVQVDSSVLDLFLRTSFHLPKKTVCVNCYCILRVVLKSENSQQNIFAISLVEFCLCVSVLERTTTHENKECARHRKKRPTRPSSTIAILMHNGDDDNSDDKNV